MAMEIVIILGAAIGCKAGVGVTALIAGVGVTTGPAIEFEPQGLLQELESLWHYHQIHSYSLPLEDSE